MKVKYIGFTSQRPKSLFVLPKKTILGKMKEILWGRNESIKTSFTGNQEETLHCQSEIDVSGGFLTLGKRYTVYGMECSDEGITYLLKVDSGRAYPFSADFFEVVDTELPEKWHCGKFQNVDYTDGSIRYYYIMGSKEMATTVLRTKIKFGKMDETVGTYLADSAHPDVGVKQGITYAYQDYDLFYSIIDLDDENVLLGFAEWCDHVDRHEEQKMRTFLSECFPENWKEQHSTWQDAVKDYMRSRSPSNGFLWSVSDLLAHYYSVNRNNDDRTIEEELLLNYGCNYWPSEESKFVKPWILQLIDMLGKIDAEEFIRCLPID